MGTPALFVTHLAQFGAVLMIVVCLFTLASRGRPQVLTALTVMVAWIGSAALQDRQNLIDPQYAVFALDLTALAVFTGLSLRYRQAWQMWIAAFQLLTTVTHIAVMIDLRIFARAYITAYSIWSYLLLAALAWGGIEGFRRRSRPAA